MLLSFINMKLRDEYDSFEALCEDLEVNAAEVEEKIRALGYEYNVKLNRFC